MGEKSSQIHSPGTISNLDDEGVGNDDPLEPVCANSDSSFISMADDRSHETVNTAIEKLHIIPSTYIF